jgi:hypothetical protein
VYEWCLDNWSNKSNKSLAEFRRPYYDSDDSRRVRKGGGWFRRVEYSRIASRGSNSPDYRNGTLGFRLALVPASAYPEQRYSSDTYNRQRRTVSPRRGHLIRVNNMRKNQYSGFENIGF